MSESIAGESDNSEMTNVTVHKNDKRWRKMEKDMKTSDTMVEAQ